MNTANSMDQNLETTPTMQNEESVGMDEVCEFNNNDKKDNNVGKRHHHHHHHHHHHRAKKLFPFGIGALPSPLYVPRRSHCSSTALFQTVVRRNYKSGLFGKRFANIEMCLDKKDDDSADNQSKGDDDSADNQSKGDDGSTDNQSKCEDLVILRAKKTAKHSYNIYDVTTTASTASFSNEGDQPSLEQPKLVGTLERVHASFRCVVYVLKRGTVQDACYVYTVHSVRTYLIGHPTRQLHVALMPSNLNIASNVTLPNDKDDQDNDDESNHHKNYKNGQQQLHDVCVDSFNRNTNLDGARASFPTVELFKSKMPLYNDKYLYGLNTFGRGRMLSCKNMQLAKFGDIFLNNIAQVCKWDTDVYSVDFRKPFNLLQAFGFALAQLDLK